MADEESLSDKGPLTAPDGPAVDARVVDAGPLGEERAAVNEAEPGEGFDVRQLYHPEVDRSIRQLPRLLAGALRLVWGAARASSC